MTILHRIFSDGFRVFFLTALVYAIAAIGVWEGFLAAQVLGLSPTLPPAPAPHLWHAHEMVFGYAGAALAGFLMTAVPNWTGARAAPARFLTLVFALWLAGRLAIWFSASLPPLLVAIADLSFLPVLATKVALQLKARPKPQNLVFLVALGLLVLANLFCHLDWMGVLPAGAEAGLRAGLITLVAMILILGGRVTPGFTRNAMLAEGRQERLPRDFEALALLAAAPALALAPAILLDLPEPVRAPLAALAGAAALARLFMWRGGWTARRPILWTLHLSYGLAGLGLIALAAAGAGWVPELLALHLLGMGAVGGMTLSVLSRAVLGHTGRALVAPRALVAAYAALPLATLARAGAAWDPRLHGAGNLLAGALWLLAFMLALGALWPACRDPRLPRAPVNPPPREAAPQPAP